LRWARCLNVTKRASHRRTRLGCTLGGGIGCFRLLRLRTALDHAGTQTLLDDFLVVFTLALELALDALDRLGFDGAHMVFHVGKTERLEHGDHVLVGQAEIPSDLVYAHFVH